ncbi:MAG: hypothetical protein MUF34_30895 [Polyangiaceae bacterium]|nr:hypothetical protein [Polyangiaceae bacterium]
MGRHALGVDAAHEAIVFVREARLVAVRVEHAHPVAAFVVPILRALAGAVRLGDQVALFVVGELFEQGAIGWPRRPS